MSNTPREPEAFTEHVARLFIDAVGRRGVTITGPLQITLDNRAVDLDDLHRATLTAPDDPEPILRRFIETELAARRLAATPLPFDLVRAKVLPRIASFEQLRRLGNDHPAAQPYLNDTYIVYLVDLAGATTALSLDQLVRWGVELDDIDAIARRNLAAFQPELELKLVHGDAGSAAVFNTGDGYDAARLLLHELHEQLAPELGGDFLVAIPSRDVFIAFPTEPRPFVGMLRERVASDYRHLPYPITAGLFLVTRDGVAPWSDAA